MARISLDYAVRCGLLTAQEQLSEPMVYHPYQFRGILKLNDGRTALVKGMMVIDSSLRSEIAMLESCVKVWSTHELPAVGRQGSA